MGVDRRFSGEQSVVVDTLRGQLAAAEKHVEIVCDARDEIHAMHVKALAELAASRQRIAEVEYKALRFDLDQAGITSRDADAVELVELRAEVAELKTTLASREAALRDVRLWCDGALRGCGPTDAEYYHAIHDVIDQLDRAAQEVGR